jgi:outer membrane protein assembly factor BamB
VIGHSSLACSSAALAAVVGFLFLSVADGADWRHYRGPSGNGVSTENVPATLPKTGPKQLWKASLGTGTSAVTVSGGRAFSMGNSDGKDTVFCLDVKTGKTVWRHDYPQELDKRMFEGGTATTPTIDGERVYTVSHQGDVFCLDAATGKKIWYKHFQKDFGGQRPQWGFAGSPTIEGNLVLLDVGGKGASTVALDKATGNLVWKSGNDEAGYASVAVATVGGRRTAIVFKAKHLVGLDVKDGRELWRTPWKTSYDVNAATPLVVGDKIFISSGYGSGCALIAINGGKVTEVWRNKNLKAHVNTAAVWEGHVYGPDDQTGGGKLACVDLSDGSLKWSEKSVAGGALIIASGKLVAVSERGELVIAEASPGGFRALSRAQVLGGRCWVQPTLADGRLFVRNNQGEVVCFSMGAGE